MNTMLDDTSVPIPGTDVIFDDSKHGKASLFTGGWKIWK